jgi:hypothetical protein
MAPRSRDRLQVERMKGSWQILLQADKVNSNRYSIVDSTGGTAIIFGKIHFFISKNLWFLNIKKWTPSFANRGLP